MTATQANITTKLLEGFEEAYNSGTFFKRSFAGHTLRVYCASFILDSPSGRVAMPIGADRSQLQTAEARGLIKKAIEAALSGEE